MPRLPAGGYQQTPSIFWLIIITWVSRYMDKYLILLSALYKLESIQALETQLLSLFLQSKNSIDILIITQEEYQAELDSRLKKMALPIHYFIVDSRTPLEASSGKLRIFEYANINQYSKVLYLDSSVLPYNQIDQLFDLEIDPSRLYGIEEGWLTHPWWGGDLFDLNTITKTATGFSTSILLFQVNDTMKCLFRDILLQIEDHKTKKQTDYLDKPYIIFDAVRQNKYDNKLLKNLIEEKNIFLRVSRLPMAYNKTVKINEFMKRIYTRVINTATVVQEERLSLNNKLQGRHFCLKELSSGTVGSIEFRDARITVHLGPNSFWGSYAVLNGSTCQVNYGNQEYILRFNSDRSFFVSIRKFDLSINHGFLE